MHEDDDGTTYETGKEWESVLYVDNAVRLVQQGVQETAQVHRDLGASVQVPDIVAPGFAWAARVRRAQHGHRPAQCCKASRHLLHIPLRASALRVRRVPPIQQQHALHTHLVSPTPPVTSPEVMGVDVTKE